MGNVELMFTQALIWYLMLMGIGIIFFPYTARIFASFSDRGYGLSKTIGIALLTFALFVLGTARVVPFQFASILAVLGLFGLGAYKLGFPHLTPKMKRLLFIEEALTMGVFFLWTYIRAYQPAIHGLEKFMDFGFINAAIRGTYFPTYDMWLAGNPINYYYFGHVTGATLTVLSRLPSYITYNLIVAQLATLSVAGTFTFVFNLVRKGLSSTFRFATIAALIGSWLVNAAGNLHTIYLLTTGYNTDNPKPFWELPLKYSLSDMLQPLESIARISSDYWYPNATRFIPFTIHEFPIYSYVVADLHGHLFDIPFALVSLCLIYSFYIQKDLKKRIMTSSLIGLFLSINLMTNAFDAPVYLGLALLIVASVTGLRKELFTHMVVIVGVFMLANIPFNMHFKPFATGVGFNCVSVETGKFIQSLLGPSLSSHFVFEGNCQTSAWWMLATLWGFFWFHFVLFTIQAIKNRFHISKTDVFVLIVCAYSSLLIVAPEFVYAKDIYPSHFRANTMFKLGYAAFIMLGASSAYILSSFKKSLFTSKLSRTYAVLVLPLLILVSVYPTLAVVSYYTQTEPERPLSLDGKKWLAGSIRSEYLEIIDYLNTEVKGQPTILEAAGDSYTDYNVVSSYTGLPTVAGWYVHQWLWRGDSTIVGALQKDIQALYEGTDYQMTRNLLIKHNISYVIVGSLEKEKYPNLQEEKFEALGQAIFVSKHGTGTIYKIPVDTW